QAPRPARAAHTRPGGAGGRARSGHRPLGELLQRGGLRRAPGPAVGALHLARASSARLQGRERFHPTFLYESLWDLAMFAVLAWWLRPRWHDRPGGLFFWYIGLYSVGRLGIEALRLDSYWLGPFRVAQLASVVGILFAVGGLVWVSRRPRTQTR